MQQETEDKEEQNINNFLQALRNRLCEKEVVQLTH